MIWWLLIFGAVCWWIGVRIGEAFDNLEGAHVLQDAKRPKATTGSNPWARDADSKLGSDRVPMQDKD